MTPWPSPTAALPAQQPRGVNRAFGQPTPCANRLSALPIRSPSLRAFLRPGVPCPSRMHCRPSCKTFHTRTRLSTGKCEAPVGEATTPRSARLGECKFESLHRGVTLGDSHAQMWMPGIIYAAEQHKLAVIPILKEGCTAGTWLSDPKGDACRAWNIWALQQPRRTPYPSECDHRRRAYWSFLLSGSELSNWAELG